MRYFDKLIWKNVLTVEPPKIVWIVQQLSNMSTDHWSFCSCQSTRSWLTRCSLKAQITTNVIHIIHISQLFLEELWHEIHQNSNIENCRHIEWKMKITAQNIRRYKQEIKYKRRQLWRRLKRIGRVEIKKSGNKIFWKLVSLTVFLKFICVICNVWYNACKTCFFDTKLWLCYSPVVSLLTLSSIMTKVA